MKFFMEKNKDAGHRVTINIPKTIVNNTIVKEFIKISKKTNINGFRKGKTPIKIIQEKFGDSVYYDVFKQLMQKFFHEFMHKEKIKIIGFPKYYIHENKDKKKEFFEYSVLYELYPKFNIKDIQNIKVKKITVKITDEDIKNHIEKYKIKNNTWNIVNRSIKSHDRVTINYSIYEKNKKLEKFNSEKISFIVSENTFIPRLNNIIINRFINDVVFLKIKFHPLHPEKELQNKDITFKIKITKIEKKQELEQTTKKNTKEKKIHKLDYQTIKKNINIQINKITEKHLEDQIIQKIIKKNIILIPPILFQEEIKILYKKYKKEYKEKNDHILEKKYHNTLDLQAQKILSMKIIIEKIISDNKLFIDDDHVKLIIKKLSLNYKKPIEIINLYNKDENLKNTIKNIELERQAIFLLKKNIEIIKEHWTFDQFINYNWKNHE